jgi:hypothetical protein
MKNEGRKMKKELAKLGEWGEKNEGNAKDFNVYAGRKAVADASQRLSLAPFRWIHLIQQQHQPTMSGVEIAVAVFAIIGGLANASKLAIDLRERRKRKNENAAEVERLDRLEASLRRAETGIASEYERLRLSPSGEFAGQRWGAMIVHSLPWS